MYTSCTGIIWKIIHFYRKFTFIPQSSEHYSRACWKSTNYIYHATHTLYSFYMGPSPGTRVNGRKNLFPSINPCKNQKTMPRVAKIHNMYLYLLLYVKQICRYLYLPADCDQLFFKSNFYSISWLVSIIVIFCGYVLQRKMK